MLVPPPSSGLYRIAHSLRFFREATHSERRGRIPGSHCLPGDRSPRQSHRLRQCNPPPSKANADTARGRYFRLASKWTGEVRRFRSARTTSAGRRNPIPIHGVRCVVSKVATVRLPFHHYPYPSFREQTSSLEIAVPAPCRLCRMRLPSPASRLQKRFQKKPAWFVRLLPTPQKPWTTQK